MAPAILNYLGWGNENAKSENAKPVRALPSSWYTSPEMYELERRAIFSKKWQLITHRTRFSQTGDWLKFNVAGYEFVLVRDKQEKINGFHNVCRHRAFPVVQGEETHGKARIFSCKYHGWSYGLDGKLAKAPKYDELRGFDKSQNGLFPINVREDATGFIWINLDRNSLRPWEEDFDGVDIQERYKQYDFDDYVLDHEYSLDGQYNWKILADNFNECYHCPTSHPDIPTLVDIETLDVNTDLDWIKHQSAPTEEQKKLGLAIASTYFFPNVSISVLPHFIMLQRFLPKGPKESTMHYQIFRNKHSSEEDFQLIHQLYKKVIAEDKGLCEQAQKNLNAGVFVNGEMHPRVEKGPLYFQKVARKTIRDHWELEKAAKREIWPARQSLPSDATDSLEDDMLCSGLACQGASDGVDW